MRALLIAGVLTAVVATIALWPRSDTAKPADPCGAVDSRPSDVGADAAGQATVCLVNRERTTRGLARLAVNALLSSASLEHSRDMVNRDYFEHSTPDGASVGDRLRAIGYARGRSASAGENIAYGVGDKATPAQIVKLWMHSPGHRADILRPAFTEIGIGIALGVPKIGQATGADERDSATYTTDFGGVVDPSLPSG